MSEKNLDDVLQDYLDERLSDRERAAFEKRLASDPQLAKRAAEYRAIGGVLRDTPAEVPLGFYARARERFQKAHPQRRGWHRLMTWEAAGLATAGLLLAAVLLPDLMVREQRDLGVPMEKARPAAAPEKEASGKSDVALEEPVPLAQEPVGQEKAKDEQRGARAEEGAEDLATAGADADEPADAFAPVPQEIESRFRNEAPESSAMIDETVPSDDRAAAAGRVEAERDDVAGEQRANRELEQAEAKQVESESEGAARLSKAQGFADSEKREQPSTPSGSVRLGWATLGPGTLAVIEDAKTWNDLPIDIRRGLGDPDFSEVRIALIGPRPRPSDCAAVRVREEADRVVIELWPGDEPRPDESCAVTLPAGPLPVTIEDHPRDDG